MVVGGKNITSTFDGLIASDGVGFTKEGSQTLTLASAAAHTYSRSTVISGGILQLGNGGSIAGLTATSEIVNNAALIYNHSNELTVDRTMTGSGTLEKLGGGVLTLTTTTNSYSGTTTVNAGTLLANNSSGSATGTGGVTVNNGGTFGGTGSISGVLTLNAGGRLSPGASIESLATGSNVWNGGSIFDFEFDTDGGTGSAGTNWDLLSITGTLDLSGASNVDPVVFNLFTMENATTSGPLTSWDETISHTWSGFVTTTGGFVDFASNKFNITTGGFQNSIDGTFSVVQNGNNLDLVYIAVPEPSAALLLGAIGAGFLLRRRRLKQLTAKAAADMFA